MSVLQGALYLLAGLAVGTAVVVLMVWLQGRMKFAAPVDPARARAAIEAMPAQLAWTQVSAGPEPTLLMRRRGYVGRAIFRPGATEVTYALDGAVDGWVQVIPESVATGMIRTFQIRDATVDDAEFEKAFEISASSPEFARSVLTDDARSILRSTGARGGFVYRVTPHVLTLRVDRHLYEPEAFENLVVQASNLFAELALPDRGVGVEVCAVTERVTGDARCEVCGTELSRGTVVRCAKCRTPHHRDCWEFNGACSTFACGETKYA